MNIVEALKVRKYMLIAAASSAIFAAAYVYSQVLGIVQNVDVWIATVPPLNFALFAVISVLFGVTLSFQIYVRKRRKTCGISKRAVGTGSAGIFSGFLVAQCPACASLGALLLPSSVFLSVFVKYGTLISVASIVLLLLTLNYLGAFAEGMK